MQSLRGCSLPVYEFACPVCGKQLTDTFLMVDAPVLGEPCDRVVCPDCQVSTIRLISSGVLVTMPKPVDVYHKNPRRQAEKIAEVMSEPLSNEEVKVGKELMLERERALHKPVGTLTTGRPKPKDQKDFDTRVKPLARKRARESRNMRSRGRGKPL